MQASKKTLKFDQLQGHFEVYYIVNIKYFNTLA